MRDLRESVLGPLLFDMVTSMDANSLYMLMIMLYCLLTRIQMLYVTTFMESCSEGLVDNKLSLRLGKTECVPFGPKRKLTKKKKKLRILILLAKVKSLNPKAVLNILVFS